eukprot:gene5726-7122_t
MANNNYYLISILFLLGILATVTISHAGHGFEENKALLGEICTYCVPEKTYLDFSPISPSGFEFLHEGDLKWGEGFPNVKVSVNGSSNPVIIGQTHKFLEMFHNPNFFNITGNQNIKSLMHFTCGADSSSITFTFSQSTKNFLLILYGITADSSIIIDSYDPYGYPVNMRNWKNIDHGLLSVANGFGGYHPAIIKATGQEAALKLKWSNEGASSYIILMPNQLISKIVVTVKGINCNSPCKGQLLYYSLLGIGSCEKPTTYAIGNFAFYDINRDGIRQPNEALLSGVTVNLYNEKGEKIATTVTNANGRYVFDNLPEGIYRVQFVVPSGATVTVLGPDNAANPNGWTDPILLAPGAPGIEKSPPGVNATYWYPKANVGIRIITFMIEGSICNDANGNGQSDPGEGLLQGIRVELYNAQNQFITYNVTNDKGIFIFDNLLSGVYNIKVVLPPGYKFTSGRDSMLDQDGWIKNIALSDSNPLVKPIQNPGPNSASYVLSGVKGCLMKLNYAIGDFAYYDVNGDGLYQPNIDRPLPGVTVQLYNAGRLVATTTTDANGKYLFDNLPEGVYDVFFQSPTGFSHSPTTAQSLPGNDGWVRQIILNPSTTDPNNSTSIQAGRVNLDIDAGFKKDLYAVGSYVWYDANVNSIREATERGVANVTVQLIQDGRIIATAVTNQDGFYFIDDIPEGRYQVKFITPDGYKFSPQGGDSKPDSTGLVTDINLTPTNPNLVQPNPNLGLDAKFLDPTINAGIYQPTFALGDFVWSDTNGNGRPDPGEVGLPGITVQLTKPGTSDMLSTVTDTNGFYAFDRLTPGYYCVKFMIPTGYTASPTGSVSVGNSTGQYCFTLDDTTAQPIPPGTPLTAQKGRFDIDQGMVPPSFAIGDFVFIDNNRDGLYDSGSDTPAGNVTVTLFDASGNTVQTTSTDRNGRYIFDRLNPGTYTVVFGNYPGYSFSPITSQSKPDRNGVVQPIVLQPGAPGVDTVRPSDGSIGAFYINRDVDAGLMPPLFSIGQYAWIDTNNDGRKQTTEQYLPGLTVTLSTPSGQVISTTTTDSNGRYKFDNLRQGQYCVTFSKPNGYVFSPQGGDSIVDSNGRHCFDLNPTSSRPSIPSDGVEAYFINPTLNAGLYPVKFTVGDLVWVDKNNNGRRDPDEPGLPNVPVTIVNKDTGTTTTTTTDGNGNYHFNDLPPGDYCVQVRTPAGYNQVATGPDSPFNQNGDNPIKNDVDIGFTPLLNVGQYVWVDTNNNGRKDPGEPLLPGVQVTLTNTRFQNTSTTTTDANGYYNFPNLAPGEYCVKMTVPANYTPVATSADSPFDANAQYCFTITDKPIDNANLGLVPLLNIHVVTWVDKNNNGKKDPTDPNLDNVPICLTPENIQLPSPADFSKLKPGRRCIRVCDPVSGYRLLPMGPDSQVDPITGEVCFQLTNNTNINIGFVPLGNITVNTWTDINNNTRKDPNEPPLDNVPICLNGTRMPSPANFGNLTPGVYCVTLCEPVNGYKLVVGGDSMLDPVTGQYCFTFNGTTTNILIGFVPLYSVGDLVWVDKNNNGRRDPGEPGLPNVPVTLVNRGTGTTTTTTTDINGNYHFDNLVPGEYCAQVRTPAGYNQVATGPDSPFNQNGEYCFTLNSNKTDVDIGFTPLLNVGQYVWVDTNNNGRKDPNEPLLPGVQVTLTNTRFQNTSTTTTDANGYYNFPNLAPGEYCVKMTVPANYIPVATSVDSPFDANAQYCFTITDKPIDNANLGLVPLLNVGVTTWVDRNNNGNKDPNDPSITNVPICITPENTQLPTPANFTGLKPGRKCIRLCQMVPGYNLVAKGPNSVIDPATGEYCFELTNNTNVEIGLVPLGNITVTTWTDINNNTIKDPNEPPLNNVPICLNGTRMPSPANFGNLQPGTYCVTLCEPVNGYKLVVGGDSMLDPVTGQYCLPFNGTSTTVVIGFVPLYSVGDLAWVDNNGNGIRDSNEPGLPGVQMTLTPANGGTPVTVTTGPNGEYTIPNLVPGNYCMTAQYPGGYVVSPMGDNKFAPSGSNRAQHCFLLTGNKTDVDIGLTPVLSIGDEVWLDTNGNGQRDSGEPGVQGITMQLTSPNGTVIDTQLTNQNGVYHFNNVIPGNYCVKAQIPSGYRQVPTSAQSPFPQGGNYCFTVTQNRTDVDLGLQPLASIGEKVWLDNNNDGVRQPNEPGVPGIPVVLKDPAGNTIATTTTDSTGVYHFNNVPPGNYCVEMTYPASYLPVRTGTDSPFSSVSPTVSRYCFPFTTTRNDVNLGLVPTYSIGDKVWTDVNGTGVQVPSSPGVPGVPITLVNNQTGQPVTTVPTGPNGEYNIPNVPPGRYCVYAPIPSGMVPVPTSTSSPFTQFNATHARYCFDLTSNRTDIDFGLRPLNNITSTVWIDTNNNGRIDSIDIFLPNVSVTLTNPLTGQNTTIPTDSNGNVVFTNLPPGNYCLHWNIPRGYMVIPPNFIDSHSNRNGDYCLVLNTTTPGIGNMGLVALGSIGNVSWVDRNNDGVRQPDEILPGVQITLTHPNGTNTTITTGPNGEYLFTNLPPGRYCVHATTPAGMTPVTKGTDSPFVNGQYCVNLLSGTPTDVRTANPGFVPSVTIGQNVWVDTNNNGRKDPGEPLLPGVPVTLVDRNGTVISTTTTDPTGNYIFSNVPPGQYCVRINTPANFSAVPTSADSPFTNGQYCFNVSTTPITNANLGVVPLTEIGRTIWVDNNGNGQRDPNEPGFPNVPITLIPQDGKPPISTTTDSNGNFNFTNVPPGRYCIHYNIPNGFRPSPTTTQSVYNSTGDVCFNVTYGVTTPPQNGGLIPNTFTVGQIVFRDQNRNGMIDSPTDVGVPNVPVTLTNTATGQTYNTTTDSNGRYQITGLPSGRYCAHIGRPLNFNYTLSGPNLDNRGDQNGTYCFDLSLSNPEVVNNTFNRANFGLYPYTFSVGTFVWSDDNGNGAFDSLENPLPNIVVSLYDSTGRFVRNTTTNAEGIYLFDNLPPGTYQIKVNNPPGTTFSSVLAQNKANSTGWMVANLTEGNPVLIRPAPGLNLTATFFDPTEDAGIRPATVAIGTYAWNDLNNNGRYDSGEPYLPNVRVQLVNAQGAIISNTTTDANGRYRFDPVTAGYYCVVFTPQQSTLVPTIRGTDSVIDSNGRICQNFTSQTPGARPATPSDGVQATYVIPNINAGYVVTTFSIGDQIWFDANNDSIFNPTEKPAPNVTVTLLNPDGSPATDNLGRVVPPQTTGADGKYLFTNIPAKDYRVQITYPTNNPNFPPGTQFSPQTGDSKANPQGVIIVTYRNQSASLDNDAGIVVPCFSIGNFAWSDGDANGIYNINEIPFPNARIQLFKEDGTPATDINGNVIAPVNTSSSGANVGRYSFSGVPAGRYYAEVTPPPRYYISPIPTEGDIRNAFSNATRRTAVFEIGINATGVQPSTAGNPRCRYQYNNVNVGIVTPSIAIGNRVFADTNRNGVMDSGEAGIGGVTVQLLNTNGQPVIGTNGQPITTTTDPNGNYYLDNLRQAQYIVQFVPPAGYTATPVKGTPSTTVDTSIINPSGRTDPFDLTLNGAQVRPKQAGETFQAPYILPTIDAGFVPPAPVAALGVQGNIWNDLFGDGIYDTNSVPPGTFTVNLLNPQGSVVGTTTMQPNGNYNFPNITAGTYQLQLVPPAGWNPTKPFTGPDRLLQSTIGPDFKTPQFQLSPTNANLTTCNFAAYQCLQFNMGVVRPSNKVINGKVYKDYNCNGNMDTAMTTGTAIDVPLAGVPVYLFYGTSTTPINQTTTDAAGQYSFAGLSDSGNYYVSVGTPALPVGTGDRVESCKPPYTNGPDYDFSFITNEDYCQDNPSIVTSCYSIGNYNGNNKDEPAVIRVPYNSTQHSDVVPIDRIGDVGTVYGIGYDRAKSDLYMSAFMKIATDYGPGRIGAIYKQNVNGTLSVFADINKILGDGYAGTDNMDMPIDINDYRVEQVYRVAFGGLTIDPYNRKLAVVNLKSRELLILPLDQTPTAQNIEKVTIPSQCNAPGNSDPTIWQPFAVTYHQGKYYVGSTCTVAADLTGYIQTVDPATKAIQTVLAVPFNYSRGCRNIDAEGVCPPANWKEWIELDSVPQPLVASLTFDGNDLIMGIRDREGDLADFIAAPDILRACADSTGKLVLERNGQCGGVNGTHLGPSGYKGQIEGPGIGEFYNDNYRQGAVGHDDTGGLGVFQVPGYQFVASTSYDLDKLWQGAIKYYVNRNGSMDHGIELYVTDTASSDPVTFGKANGLGDLVALCRPKPTMIGTFVFTDSNGNGIFDPTEAPVAGATVNLLRADGSSAGTATTNAAGAYRFSVPAGTYKLQLSSGTSTTVPSNTNTQLPTNKSTMQSGKPTIDIVINDSMTTPSKFDSNFGLTA